MHGGSRGPSGAERAGRRDRPVRTRYQQRSFVERYRAAIVALGVIVVVAAVAGFVLFQATQPVYACSQQFTPQATPTPSSSADVVGYPQTDEGTQHIAVGTQHRYTLCPPASGWHYNVPGTDGPMPARFYGPDENLVPQNWVHNLEHGGLVVLYSCDQGGCDSSTQQQLKDLVATFPNSPVCNLPASTPNFSPVVARFEQMPHRFAALVWDRVFYEDTLDTNAIKTFYANTGERGNPEPECSPSPSPSELGSPAASGSPAPSASASPAESPSAAPSGSASPVESPSPSS